MRFNDQFDFVIQHIKKNKLRVFMTVLATTMGCAFLIMLASVGFGMQKTVVDDILSNENVTSITMNNVQEMQQDEIVEIENMEHVQHVLPETKVNAIVNYSFQDRTAVGNMLLTDFVKYEKVKEPLAEGNFPKAENEVIVGYHFAQTLLNEEERQLIEQKAIEAEKNGTWYDGADEGYKQSVIGKEFELTFSPFENSDIKSEPMKLKVVGIMAKPTYDWMSNSSVYISEQAASKVQQLFESVKQESDVTEHEPLLNTSYTIYAEQLMYVESILEKLRSKGYMVYSVTEQLNEVNKVFAIVKIGLVFVGTIAVLIASIGIFNTMTMAVTERTREIGVMKAIGASPKLILRLFLMESAFIGFFGTALAIVISYGISFATNAILPVVLASVFNESGTTDLTFSYIPWELVVVAGIISIGVAIVSGIRPAKKATKIEVMQALRQEL